MKKPIGGDLFKVKFTCGKKTLSIHTFPCYGTEGYKHKMVSAIWRALIDVLYLSLGEFEIYVPSAGGAAKHNVTSLGRRPR